MKNFLRTAALVAFAATFSVQNVEAQTMSSNKMPEPKTIQVGGEAMFPMKNIVQNAVNSHDTRSGSKSGRFG